ncbi:MAG TPA: acyl-CoA dehydrogenase family protein [Phototrophicaceae bacterium]|nr:acyl-CoA dehydrogenase family protein [Phototrophicaceae bacterium]
MVDFQLSPAQASFQQTARQFAQQKVQPIVDEIDRQEFSQCTPWEHIKAVYQEAASLGFTTLLIPERYGGGGAGCFDNVLLLEEIGAVDVGVAASYFNTSITAPLLIVNGGNETQRECWLREITQAKYFVIASAGNEPNQAGSDALCPLPDPQVGLKTTAQKDGDGGYILNGTKAAFITNAGIANAYLVAARTDLTQPPMVSTSFFYIPANLGGIHVGNRTPLTGWHSAHNAEVHFENVRVPEMSRLGEEGTGVPVFLMRSLPYIAIGLAACYVGLARAAYEYALAYAQQRISWGVPIIRHQAVAAKIAEMNINVQAARLIVWEAAWAVDHDDPSIPIKSPTAKTFATEMAIKNAQLAVQVLGAYGITNEYKAAKMLNDAWIGWSCDGTNDVLRLHMANFLGGMMPPMP